jgi:hypothetical protein
MLGERYTQVVNRDLFVVACVKFSKKKSEKMCRIRFGFFEKRTIAFRLAVPLPHTGSVWGRTAPPI